MILKNKTLGKEVTLHERVELINVEFGEYNEIGQENRLENVKMDSYSYTGQYCFIQNAHIGKFVNMAAFVRIGPTDHPIERPTLHHFTYRASMYGFAYKDEEDFFEKRDKRITSIGHDTWIGHGAIVKPEVRVGNGAVIGAGAIVTKDVPPYGVVVGNPAKIIKYRFLPETIQELERIKWWDWTYEKIKENYQDFLGPVEKFIEKHKKEG